MRDLPTGTVTFLFTDIEGSTRLLQELGGDRYDRLQEQHAEILTGAIDAGGGVALRTEGDSYFAVFPTPGGALAAAVTAQRGLAGTDWPEGATIRVRMGLHTGEGRLGGDDYLGIDVNRAARIAAAGHGGQVLLSEATRALVQHGLPDGVRLRDLGEHRLKDIAHPERIFDLVIDGLAATFPELKSLDARPNNLPAQLSSFIGREEEIAETVRLLADHRLVTLTGPGGTGKTRLAIEVAAEVLPRFADGVFLVELAPVADPAQVCPAVAQVLSIREAAGCTLLEMMESDIADKELLLVLDNFEHLPQAAPFVDQLLRTAPRLRVLVTSRTPLRLYGEQEQPVLPLALPDPDHLPELRALSQYEAVALFIERAREARPGFQVTNDNAPAVAELCSRLDGLPLAIELAASRMKILSPHAVLSRLATSLDLLTASARNLPERQRTLRGAIQWSYGLLDEPERRLFARMSAFAGGADLQAAETVANPGEDLGVDTLGGLASLVDNSLVRQTETQDGEPRFAMLETIREYAGERLVTEADAEATHRRHARHFLALAEESEPHLTKEDQAEWLDRLDRDHDNLLAALRWAIDAGEADLGMRAAASVWRFWHQRGYFGVGRLWLERLLALPGGRTAARAKAYGAVGSLAYWQTDYEATERYYTEGLAISREVGDPSGIAEALYNLGYLPVLRGTDLDHAVELFEEALAIYRDLEDIEGAARAVADIGFVRMMQGQYEAALPLLQQAVAGSRERGDLFRLADDLFGVGQANRLVGNHDEARAAFLESLEILERADNPVGIATVAEMMSALETALGRHQRAMRLLGASRAISEAVGGAHPPIAALLGDPEGDARKAIGDEATDRALAEGRAMSRDEAVAYARKTES